MRVGDMIEQKETLKHHIITNNDVRKNISFIISSRNGLENSRLVQTLALLKDRISSYNYEVLVYGPSIQPMAENLTFVNVETRDEGSAYGYNLCASKSTGEYICVLTDYSIPPDNIDDLYQFLKKNNISSSTFSACNHEKSSTKASACPLSSCTAISGMGQENPFIESLLKRDGPILFFPVIHKTILNRYLNGFLFNPYFHHRWVDNWLGYFCSKIDYFVNDERKTKSSELYDFSCCTGACGRTAHKHVRNDEFDEYDSLIMQLLLKNDGGVYDGRPYISRDLLDTSIDDLAGTTVSFAGGFSGQSLLESLDEKKLSTSRATDDKLLWHA